MIFLKYSSKYVICNTLIDLDLMRTIAIFLIVVSAAAIPDQASVVFANTFNLPVDLFQPSKVKEQGRLRKASQKLQMEPDRAFHLIQDLAKATKLPSKSVRNFQNRNISLIISEQNGEIYKYTIMNEDIIIRLYSSLDKQLLEVPPSLLSFIPDGQELDKFTQLVRQRNDSSVYFAQNGIKRQISPAQFENFGFSLERVLDLEPAIMQLFETASQLK